MKNSVSQKPHKIIFVIDTLIMAGAQRHLALLVKGLIEKFSVQIICLGTKDEHVISGLPHEVKIHYIDMQSIRKISFWKGFRQLITLLKEQKPTFLHTYLNTANVFGIIAARMAGVPIILSSRRDMGSYRSKFIGKMEQLTNHLSDKVVCVSYAVKNKNIKEDHMDEQKAVVLYNGVDAEKFMIRKKEENGQGKIIIGMVATMDRKVKGHHYFIEVAEKILLKRQDITFVLIGDGQFKNKLSNDVVQKGLSQYFHFKGRCEDIPNEIKHWRLFVMPSFAEGLSNAILEAMSMGVPIIANDLAENKEAIDNGITGFLTETGNSQGMADKILKIIDQPDLLNKIGKYSRQKVLNQFTNERMISNYRTFYEGLLKEKKISSC